MVIIPNRFEEKIYGNIGVGYHRTKSEDVIRGILDKGFMPGSGDSYGPGWYTCYDMDSQLKENMEKTYGNILVKVKFPMNNMLILDYDVAKIVYKQNYTLVEQWKRFFPESKKKNIQMKITKSNHDALENEYGDIHGILKIWFLSDMKARMQTISGIIKEFMTGEDVIRYYGEPIEKKQLIFDSDRRPFFGNWKDMLPQLHDLYVNKRRELENMEFFVLIGDDPKATKYLVYTQAAKVETEVSVSDLYNEIEEISKNLEKRPPITSDIALKIIKVVGKSQMSKFVDGVVFTGRRDGRVTVIYNYKTVIPMSFCFTQNGKIPDPPPIDLDSPRVTVEDAFKMEDKLIGTKITMWYDDRNPHDSFGKAYLKSGVITKVDTHNSDASLSYKFDDGSELNNIWLDSDGNYIMIFYSSTVRKNMKNNIWTPLRDKRYFKQALKATWDSMYKR